MAKRLVVANWKMYIESPESAKEFAKKLRRSAPRFSGADVVLAPSFPLLPVVAAALKGSKIRAGAQNLSAFTDGMHTGEVSARMLSLSGASAVIIGHSERRAKANPALPDARPEWFRGENDDQIALKLRHADAEGLRSILCVGEQERDAGGGHFMQVAKHLRSALDAKPAAARLVIAYEPVWAIGKGAADAMKPQDVQEMVIYIRKIIAESMGRTAALRVPVIYGGSVEPDNARALITEGGVSGFLVGHASADIDSFLAIVQACSC